MKKIINVFTNGIADMSGYNTDNYTEEELQELVDSWNEEDNDPDDYYEVVDGE